MTCLNFLKVLGEILLDTLSSSQKMEKMLGLQVFVQDVNVSNLCLYLKKKSTNHSGMKWPKLWLGCLPIFHQNLSISGLLLDVQPVALIWF